MIVCTGVPAEQFALPYVEGTLAEFEMERFEEHYFDCAVCLSHVQALQAAGSALRRQPQPIEQLPASRMRAPLAWPVRVRALAAAAALLVAGFFTYRIIVHQPAQPTAAHNTPAAGPRTAPAPRAAPAPTGQAAQLADLTLPAFVPSLLRGESPDPHFEAGMNAYANGNCREAISELSQVAAAARESGVGRFYLGVCQLGLDNLAAASAALRQIANAGDSPQQEAALYYLAQISLKNNDPVRAHRYLVHAISLRGDMERRARAEDRQVTELIGKESQDPTKTP